jgi:hypothetical protein
MQDRAARLVGGGAALLAAGLLLLLVPGGDDDEPPSPAEEPPPATGDGIQACEEEERVDAAPAPSAAVKSVVRRARRTLPVLVSGVVAFGAGAQAQAAPAKRADAFVDSIGVNLHLTYSNTPYGRYKVVTDKLMELGVRHVRDGVGLGRPDVYRALRVLASCGIRTNLIVGDPQQRYGTGSLGEQLAMVKRELIPAVETLEGPNEYNNTTEESNLDWPNTLRGYQERLYRLAEADPALSRIPRVAPSLVGPGSHDLLGDMSRFVDFGNIHPYPGGNEPDSEEHLTYHLDLAARVAGSKPVLATETGYHNALNVRAGGHGPATEEAAGVYMPRLFLEYFRAGYARAFAYELIDQFPSENRMNPEANFGLLRNDFSEKPAFTAVERLIDLLRDPGPGFRPRPLNYSIQGGPPTLRQLLLQKRDGTHYLALWNQVSVWDPKQRVALNPATVDVELALGRRARQIELYRPNESGRPLLRRTGARTLPLQLLPRVTVLRIVPERARLRPAARRHGPAGHPRRCIARRRCTARRPCKRKRRRARVSETPALRSSPWRPARSAL